MFNIARVMLLSETLFEPFLLGMIYRSVKLRVLLAGLLLAVLLSSSSWLFFGHICWYTAVLMLGSIFRGVNIMRFGYGRMKPDYLKKVARRSAWRLVFIQLLTILVAYAGTKNSLVPHLILAGGLGFLILMNQALFKNTKSVNVNEASVNLLDSPVVTVAIPARNETQDMAECIQSVLDSDYPKLEILVLDDCSHDKTPDVIKQYAHAGVRFIQGEEPTNGWLAKNVAYEKLKDEAVGELILFCGVDIRFDKSAISDMVGYMQHKKLQMISVLPRRVKHVKQALFFQAARYAWELALPRFMSSDRPPALSSVWLTRKEFLGHQAFKGVAHSVMPERYFARKASQACSYEFLAGRNLKLVHSHKSAQAQAETAIRLRYPQLRKRPEHVFLYLVIIVVLFFMPIILLITSLSSLEPSLIGLLSLACLVCWGVMAFSLFRVVSGSREAILLVLLFPLVIVVDIIVSLKSMWRYEFGIVEWKGRNVCLPIMHVVPRLPKY